MKSKRLAVFTAAILAVSLTACSNKSDTVSSKIAPTSDSAAETTTTTVASEVFSEIVTEDTDTNNEEDLKREQEMRDRESIEQLIKDGDYHEASSELGEFEYTYGEDELYNDIKKRLTDVVLDELHSVIEEKRADGSIIAAVEYVRDEKGYYTALDEVKTLYDSLVDEYADSVVSEAKKAALDGDFDRASELITAAKHNIGNDNEKLTAFEEQIAEYHPVYLFELSLFNYEGEKPSMGFSNECREKYRKALSEVKRHEVNDRAEIEDSAGNTYLYSYYVGSAIAGTGGECFSEYLINGQYDAFSGVVAVSSNPGIGSGPAYFIVYGDGKELYTSPTMDKGSKPKAFSVDVKGVDTLRIQFYHTGKDGIHSTATIFDGALTVTPDFE